MLLALNDFKVSPLLQQPRAPAITTLPQKSISVRTYSKVICTTEIQLLK